MKRAFYTLSLAILWACLTLQAQDKNNTPAHKLSIAEFAIANLYVEKVDEEKLVEEAIRAMLKELDPHSNYITAQEWKQMNEPLQGNFEGIGVQFNMVEDTLVVIQPIADGPSERVGILAGDRIITVNDTTIAGVQFSSEEIVRRLKGPKGTLVQLGVKRAGIPETLQFTVKRNTIPVYSIDASYMAAPHIGYIRVNNFAATTAQEFQQAIKQLKKQGMTDLLLDLQGNGGGLLNAAVDMANEFLDQRDLIVYTEGLRSPQRAFHAKGNGCFRSGRVVVLVDSYSASAAEILAGAIQDWDRGLVVGRRTFGKGLVQRIVDLPDGSAMRLTVSRYYTPSGRCIQKPYEKTIDYHQDLVNRYNSGELTNADNIHFPDSLQTKTLRLGRTVYGGGGIMPDYYIPLDTLKYTPYQAQISAKGILLKAALHYVDQHRATLKHQYKQVADFAAKFQTPSELLQTVVDAATDAGITYTPENYEASCQQMMLQLKALIARHLWDLSAYYYIINAHNETFQRAMQLLENSNFDSLMKKEKPI